MIDVFVINLEKNIERKKFMLKMYDDKFNLNFVRAIYDERPNKGCFLSHQKCIQYAKDNNMDYIIVMEDDCKKRDDLFVDKLKTVLEYLESNMNKWDVFLGGTTNVNKDNILEKDNFENMKFVYLDQGNTTHFIIYNKKCYDYFLNYDFNGTSVDKIWHKKLVGLVTLPFIFFQQPCYSDIEGKYKNYNKSFLKAENNLK